MKKVEILGTSVVGYLVKEDKSGDCLVRFPLEDIWFPKNDIRILN